MVRANTGVDWSNVAQLINMAHAYTEFQNPDAASTDKGSWRSWLTMGMWKDKRADAKPSLQSPHSGHHHHHHHHHGQSESQIVHGQGSWLAVHALCKDKHANDAKPSLQSPQSVHHHHHHHHHHCQSESRITQRECSWQHLCTDVIKTSPHADAAHHETADLMWFPYSPVQQSSPLT